VHLLVLLALFAALVLLCLQTSVKNLNLKATKHEKIYSLPTAKHNSINALVSKSLNYNVVTDWGFQIFNSELEKYFELNEAVRSKLKVTTGPGPDIKKLKQQLRNEVRDEFQKKRF